MMKFFRLYTKQLLAVFMALLLIVWLGGDALTALMRTDYDSGKETRGTAFGATVKLRDMWPSMHQAELLEHFGLPIWKAPWMLVLMDLGEKNPQMAAYGVRNEPLTNEEWYMLDTAARRAGVHVPPQAIEKFKERFGLTEQAMAAIQSRERRTAEEIDDAIRSLLRVEQAAMMAAQALKVSEADLNELVRQTGEKARIVAAVLTDKSFVDNSWEPTPQEIQAQFEKYKNVTSQPGTIGYEQPAAAQIEYIEVVRSALSRNQKVEEDEAYAYWKSHSSEFMKPTSQPATKPAEPKPYTTFSEARPRVVAKLQDDRASEQAQRIAREIIDRLSAPWNDLTTTRPTDAKTAPDSEKAADVYTKLVSEFNAKYPGAIRYAKLEMMTPEQLRTNPFGMATALRQTPQQMSLADAAFTVPGGNDKDLQGGAQRFFRGLFQTASDPFVTVDGGAVVMRTIAIRPKQAPASIDLVRNEIVKDLRDARAHEEARKAAEKLQAEAAKVGVEAALDADAALKQKLGPDAIKKPAPFPAQNLYSFWGPPTLYPANIPELQASPEVTEKIFAMAARTATQPVKVTVAEDKNQNRYIVAQMLEVLPVTQAELEKERARLLPVLQMQRRVEALRGWFDAKQIRERVQWVDAQPVAPQKPGSDDGKTAPATDAEG